MWLDAALTFLGGGRRTADAEIKVPAAKNPELSNEVLSLMPGVRRNVALQASQTARKSNILISTLSLHSPPPQKKKRKENQNQRQP